MRRRDVIAGFGVATAWAFAAGAQQRVKPQIGYLGSTSPTEQADKLEALQEGLRLLGYTDGTNITIHYRWANENYDLLPELAADLARLNLDLILTHGTPGTRAAVAATTTVPVVAIVVGDLLSPGLVPSLARPGGNLTGQTFFFAEICAKRVEIINSAIPGLKRIAVLINPANTLHPLAVATMKHTADLLSLELRPGKQRAAMTLAAPSRP